MKATDFIEYFEFKTHKPGRVSIGVNQCSYVYFLKYNYYFRFKGQVYNYLKIGKLKNDIVFVLNNQEGIKAKVHHNQKSFAFYNKEAMELILKLHIKDFDKNGHYKGKIVFREFEKSKDEKILILEEVL